MLVKCTGFVPRVLTFIHNYSVIKNTTANLGGSVRVVSGVDGRRKEPGFEFSVDQRWFNRPIGLASDSHFRFVLSET